MWLIQAPVPGCSLKLIGPEAVHLHQQPPPRPTSPCHAGVSSGSSATTTESITSSRSGQTGKRYDGGTPWLQYIYLNFKLLIILSSLVSPNLQENQKAPPLTTKLSSWALIIAMMKHMLQAGDFVKFATMRSKIHPYFLQNSCRDRMPTGVLLSSVSMLC